MAMPFLAARGETSLVEQFSQFDSVAAGHLFQIGQLQKAVHHAGESIHLALHNTEECLCGLRRKILFLTKQTDPGLEDGQRGTKFVGSILGEAALHQKSPAQPLRQVIKGMCQLCYLIPSIRDGQGLIQILSGPALDLVIQVFQRRKSPAHQQVDQ